MKRIDVMVGFSAVLVRSSLCLAQDTAVWVPASDHNASRAS